MKIPIASTDNIIILEICVQLHDADMKYGDILFLSIKFSFGVESYFEEHSYIILKHQGHLPFLEVMSEFT